MVVWDFAMRFRFIPAAIQLTALALATVTLTGCARAQAKVVVEPPRLDVPLPPPRVIETARVDPLPVPPELPAGAPADITPPAAPVPPPAAAVKPEPRQVEPSRADVTVPTEPVGPRLAAPLQAAPAQQEVRLEAEIRKLMSTASTGLQRIDYRALPADARNQYDTAKNFLLEAENQLRVKNFPFARSLADRAATLAAQLAGR
jgi:hypothetical protein